MSVDQTGDRRIRFTIAGHRDCMACGKSGFFVRGFTQTEDGGVSADVTLDERSEGWIGKPHGGFGMATILELLSGIDGYPADPADRYPLEVDFRMGGAAAEMGETVCVAICPTASGAVATIESEKATQPYVLADISYRKKDPNLEGLVESYLAKCMAGLDGPSIPMPYYRRCLVCGVSRSVPGLRRKFELIDATDDKLVVSRMGFDPEDDEHLLAFHQDHRIHPGVFAAIGDEAMGWGGLFLSRNGGVSVRLKYVYHREVQVGERLVAFGRGERVRGDIRRRLMWYASGGVAAIRDGGEAEIAVSSSGQFMAVPALTEEMRNYLIPKEWTDHLFEILESKSTTFRR